jgi:disulfide bond formation protein DsbB
MPEIVYPKMMRSYGAGGLVLCGAVVIILTALGFEHWGGYAPCPLCLQQRYAYYASIPLLALALVLVAAGYGRIAAALFVAVSLAFLLNAALGLYQAGAEWKFWQGPTGCAAAGPLSRNAGDLLKDLATTRVVRCDEAAWRLLGLSFAGWNTVCSLALAGGAVLAALGTSRR